MESLVSKGIVVCTMVLALVSRFGVSGAVAASGNLRINEVYYDPPVASAEEHLFEFIELYVVCGGLDPSFWYLTDWDESNAWQIPASCPVVATGEYIVVHIGPGTDDNDGPVYHYYMGRSSGQLSNLGDPLSLHEDQDSTHARESDPVHDFMTYEGGTDPELESACPWAGWPNDGTDPTDSGTHIASNLGQSAQLMGADLDNGSNWEAAFPTPGADNSRYAPVHWAMNIEDAKSNADGCVVGVTATVHTPIGLLNFERRQFWVQDFSGGIVVDNTPERTLRPYACGDVLSLTGSLRTSAGVRELVLQGDPGAPIGHREMESAKSLTISEFRASVVDGSDEYQSELVSFDNVLFDDSVPRSWKQDTSYRIRQAGSPVGSATAYIRIEDGCELVGREPPQQGPFAVIGEASRFYDYPRILPRFSTDVFQVSQSEVQREVWQEY